LRVFAISGLQITKTRRHKDARANGTRQGRDTARRPYPLSHIPHRLASTRLRQNKVRRRVRIEVAQRDGVHALGEAALARVVERPARDALAEDVEDLVLGLLLALLGEEPRFLEVREVLLGHARDLV